MEARREDPPLKVCPHCSVATRTDAETCPSCGRSYVRGRQLPRLRWRWWLAIPIVAAAFLLGFFAIGPWIRGDDSGSEVAITVDEGAAVPEGISRADLESRLEGAPSLVEPRRGMRNTTCAYYPIEDTPDAVWEFCFRDDEMISSGPKAG